MALAGDKNEVRSSYRGPPWVAGLFLFFGAYFFGSFFVPSPLLEGLVLWVLWRWLKEAYTRPAVWGRGLGDRRLAPAAGLLALSWFYAIPLAVLVIAWWQAVAPAFVEFLEEMSWTGGEMIAAVTVGPILEEIVFRGFCLRAWAQRWGLAAAVILSSALFALSHPQEPVGAFVFAVTLCALRLRYGTLWVPIVFHALFNLGVLALSTLENSPLEGAFIASLEANTVAVSVVTILGMTATLVWSYRLMAGRELIERRVAGERSRPATRERQSARSIEPSRLA